MYKYTATLVFLFLMMRTSWSQQNLLPISSFYKDKLFSPLKAATFSNGSFLPISEGEYDLHSKIADSSRQYYELTAYLVKKHLLEITGDDYYFTVSPTIDVRYGKDQEEFFPSTKFQNTRGFVVEGDFFKNFSFTTSFYENQARFTSYETAYFSSVGEMYPNGPNYSTQNAVISGAARTKPFKTDAFDYAYSVGNVVYRPSNRLQFSGGNNAHFIGAGHRSLLLSDNSINAPYLRANVKISTKISFIFMRARLMNLLRRPLTTSDEAYYEPKAFSTNYLSYKVNEKCMISLFEGVIWSKGDSVTSTRVHPMFYNPIPLLSEAVIADQQKMSTLLGLNIDYILNNHHHLYGQLAMSNFDSENIGMQLGYRGYDFFKTRNLMLQLEYNYVPKNLYQSSNSRLNYSQSNLPLAHTKGNGFQEFILRFNYEYERVYFDMKVISYALNEYQSGSLLPVKKNTNLQYGTLQHDQFEIGYRFNRKLNLAIFGSYLFRRDFSNNAAMTRLFSVGIRTGLDNHYNDF
jgi:hypothetical protein